MSSRQTVRQLWSRWWSGWSSVPGRRSGRSVRQRHGVPAVLEQLETRQLLAASGIQAFHRSGQTFVTWTEDAAVTGEQYHVYRHTAPITTANLAQAQLLTGKWGPLDDNTSVHQYAAAGTGVPSTFVIQDLGTPLSTSTGLFVYTTPDGQAGTYYYAVTQVTNGTENQTLTAGVSSLLTGVSEAAAVPQPVLTVSTNGGKGRIYTQYMDYARWNPTFQGYAYNYSVALPDNYDSSRTWPVKLMPHAYGERFHMEPSAEYGWPCIEVFVDDSGGTSFTYQTWWYGFAADHNYRTGGTTPTSGTIENFTEQRVLKALDEVAALFSVDPLLIHAQGHSMGASGSLSLGMRYPGVFSGIFASEPMTNYASSPLFQDDFTTLWGTQASNLPIVNRGPHAADLQKYNGTGVYNWMNHHEQLVARRGDDMAFLMVGHGKADDVIDWETQGKPFIAALNAGRAGFTAEQRYGWDHNWMSFDFAHDAMFSPADGGLSAWTYPVNLSFPAFTYGSGSGPDVPGTTGTNFYNLQFEWSVPWNHFHTDILDTAARYEISLRSTAGSQTADVTPRRLQAFSVVPGQTVTWSNVLNATGQTVQSGTVTVGTDGLVTIPRLQISTDTGNRLILVANDLLTAPVLTGPAATTTSQTPQFSWTSVATAASYNLWISNLSTGANPAVSINTTATSWTPAASLGIGRYRIWVQSVSADGRKSPWSGWRDLKIETPVTLNALPAMVMTDLPQFSWSALPGATRYDVWLSNNTTGQSPVLRDTNVTGTSFQVTQSLPIGKYSLWVRGLDAAGIGGAWSAVRTFQVAPRTTLLAPLQPGFDQTPEFLWAAVNGATEYEVYVQDLKTSAVVIDQKGITGTSWTPAVPLPDSNYRWWVQASRGPALRGTWSYAADFNVSGRAVVLTSGGTTAGQTPVFSWTAVTGAARYELWVSRLDLSQRVIHETQLTSTSFTPTQPLLPASYRIWVRAIRADSTYGPWSDAVTITVTG